jgi:hypothetical protein
MYMKNYRNILQRVRVEPQQVPSEQDIPPAPPENVHREPVALSTDAESRVSWAREIASRARFRR